MFEIIASIVVILCAFYVMYNIYMEIKNPAGMFFGFAVTAAVALALMHPHASEAVTNTAGVVGLFLMLIAAYCHNGRAFEAHIANR